MAAINLRFLFHNQKLNLFRASLPLLVSLSPFLFGGYAAALAADSDSADWTATYQQGAAAMQKGDFQSSERFMRQAYDMSKGFKPTDVRYLSSLDGLALALTRTKKYSEAEKFFVKALAAKGKVFADDDPEMAKTRANMAALLGSENRYREADALFRTALAHLAPDSPMALEATFNLTDSLIEEGKFDEAATDLSSLVEKFTSTYGAESVWVVYARLGLVHNSLSRGDFRGALGVVEDLLGDPKALANPKVDPHLVMNALSAKATCLMELGKYSEAESCNLKSAELIKASDGEQSENYARNLHRLGKLYTQEQKFKAAEKVFEQARALLEKNSSGKQYQSDLLLDTARLAIGLGRYERAESLLNQAIKIVSENYGERHPDIAPCLGELAYVQAQKNDLLNAEKNYNLALSIDDESVGRNVPSYSLALSRLGDVYVSENKLDAAETALKEALTLREQNLPPGHKDIVKSMNDLAEFYRDHAFPTKAETMYRRVMSFDDKYNAKQPALKIGAMEGLESAIRAQGKSEYADGIASETMALKKKLPGFRTSDAGSDKTAPTTPLKVIGDPIASKWALCVGISSFQDQSINLKYAAKDATDFKNFLITKGNFPADHVQLLTDENASRENILSELGEKWLGQKVKKDDLVVIYISSHGSQSMQAANNTNFLVAYDTNKDALLSTGIPMQWLSQIIKEQVPSDRILLVLDVCHSGSVVDGEKGLVRHDSVDVSKVAPTSGQIVICSSSADQVSWESKEYPNSVFTRRLIQALDAQGTSTTLTDAYKTMKSKVEEEVLRDRQTMQNPAIKQSFEGASLKPLAAVTTN